MALAGDDQSALLADWQFMAALVEAAGNLVFQLIMNSVRELYLPRADAFAALVADRRELARALRAGGRLRRATATATARRS